MVVNNHGDPVRPLSPKDRFVGPPFQMDGFVHGL